MLVIPDMQKAEMEDCNLKLAMGKNWRPYLKNKLKQKGLEV
jgi:hypothetical protein